MLPRSLNELYEQVRDFHVVENNKEIVAVCALHTMWQDLAEIRSLVVTESAREQGIGKRLVSKCIAESRRLGINRIFALTYSIDFFLKLGFKEIDKSELPQKIWVDCIKCHKFPDCDEYAVIKEV